VRAFAFCAAFVQGWWGWPGAARGLRAAGLPITSAWTIQVDSLMSEARAFGTLVQSRPVTP